VPALVHEVRRARLIRACGGDQFDGIADDLLGHRHLAHEIMKLEHILAGEQRLDRAVARRSGLLHDRDLVLLRQVVDHHVEHEAVELRLGQRIRALHLDRVLRGQHEERLGQGVAHAGGGDLMLLHGLEQGCLCLGRRPVDLVRENDVGEDRAGDEGQLAALGGVLEDFRARDVRRHEVGRELHALELQVENLRERFDEQGFGQTGCAGDQAMTAGKESDENLLHDLTLADDDLAEFLLNLGVARPELLDQSGLDRRW
jgi:hypothetical protein